MSKTIFRGSAKHRILAELERYPDEWVRWYQLPTLGDLHRTTILQAIQRLIRSGKVQQRRVFDEDATSTAKPQGGGRGFWYIEIRHRDEDGAL